MLEIGQESGIRTLTPGILLKLEKLGEYPAVELPLTTGAKCARSTAQMRTREACEWLAAAEAGAIW